MAFNLRSGNASAFKSLGSSPAKKHVKGHKSVKSKRQGKIARQQTMGEKEDDARDTESVNQYKAREARRNEMKKKVKDKVRKERADQTRPIEMPTQEIKEIPVEEKGPNLQKAKRR